jgi:hypothetical protein
MIQGLVPAGIADGKQEVSEGVNGDEEVANNK